MSEQPQQICILGGGFGGLYTALRLDQLPWERGMRPEIVLVDQRDRFLFTPLLYELLTDELQTWEIAPPFAELLAETDVRFCQGRVVDIAVDQQQVLLDGQAPLAYDRLAIALGGITPRADIPGWSEQALPFRSLVDAECLRARLRDLERQPERDKIRVAIVGGGYSGIELACKLADRLGTRGRIRIIERGTEILKGSPEFNRQAARQALSDRQIWLDLETTVTAMPKGAIALDYRGRTDEIPVDLVLWTVGTRAVPWLTQLPLKQDERGLLVAEATLQLVDHPELFALGDAAANFDASGQRIPATAQAALQQADFCAWNLWASLTDRPLLPYRYFPLGEMLALGTDSAVLSGLGLKLDGPLAYLARRLAYLYRMPTLQHQLAVGVNWLTRPALTALSQLAL
ncbi:MAG: NAD(P)/FAD-dependent oxidoreductase [Spirulinaceae cyanobacterium SM2_1_0]|nr:NAD(P)/FAD-dependent oxidoreductase [Spirulinaceae cyanobacterium SM2_1_0]